MNDPNRIQFLRYILLATEFTIIIIQCPLFLWRAKSSVCSYRWQNPFIKKLSRLFTMIQGVCEVSVGRILTMGSISRPITIIFGKYVRNVLHLHLRSCPWHCQSRLRISTLRRTACRSHYLQILQRKRWSHRCMSCVKWFDEWLSCLSCHRVHWSSPFHRRAGNQSFRGSFSSIHIVRLCFCSVADVATILKLLWEGNGFLLLYKWLDNGKFQWPRSKTEALLLTLQQRCWLLEGLNIK